MNKLIKQLKNLSPRSESFQEVIQAKENLVKNLSELDALIQKRIAFQQDSQKSPFISQRNSEDLERLRREIDETRQKNKLYSTELSIAVGYHMVKTNDAIVKSASELDTTMHDLSYFLAGSAVLSVAMSIFIALYIQFSIANRIVKLQQAVNRKHTLPDQIPSSGKDEIGNLAKTIKSYIQKSIDDEKRILNINKELSILASYDSLTSLYNRQHFEKIATEFSKIPDTNYCISIVDIDHFKAVNDTYGHKTGDIALVHIAAILKDGLRATDILARYGGEEFVIMMLNADQDTALVVVERIRHVIETTTLHVDDAVIHLTASFGIAQKTCNEQTLDSCLRCADIALYAAKNSGRNAIVTYYEELGFCTEA